MQTKVSKLGMIAAAGYLILCCLLIAMK